MNKNALNRNTTEAGDEVLFRFVRGVAEREEEPCRRICVRRRWRRHFAAKTTTLVLNKFRAPPHGGGSGLSFGVIEGLRALRPEARFELVHRLDRDTSGAVGGEKRLRAAFAA